ncbi:MAG TPA: SPOR domain-containing protein, partial [Candidatus Binatia bacterium]
SSDCVRRKIKTVDPSEAIPKIEPLHEVYSGLPPFLLIRVLSLPVWSCAGSFPLIFFMTDPLESFKLFKLSLITFVLPSSCINNLSMNLLNLFRCPILKPTAASIDKEALRWSLSWHPEGHCDSFTKGAILLFAPPTSGVYGLFNFDCQVFIGESENIQEALLRHESETDFQSQGLQPTGFTFEPCAAELRKSKADELIARFHPVLQTEAASTETWSASNGSRVSEAGLGGQEETYPDHEEFPLHECEKQPKARRHFYFKRTQGAALAAMFVASVIVIFYLGIPAGKNIQKQVKPLPRITITQPPAPGRAQTGLRPQNVSLIDTAGANQSTKPTPVKPDVHVSAATSNDPVRFPAKGAAAADGARVQALLEPAKTTPIAHSAGGDSSKKWSVQISAASAEDIADTLVRRLKASGYDGYVVRAEVKGQTYYRVRVGHFEAREEAESLRQLLTRQEGYRDAYLTGD